MNATNSAHTLKSIGIGKIFLKLLWLRLGLSIASTVFSLVRGQAEPFDISIAVLIYKLLLNILEITVLTSVVLFFIWLYRIHVDLKYLFDSYPVTPGGAIAKFLIPIYNIWGVANVLSTFANKFKLEGADLNSLGKKVSYLIIPLYVLTFSSNAIGRLMPIEITNNPNSASLPFLYLLSGAVNAGLVYVLILVTQAMQKAVAQKAKRAVA